MPHFVPHFKFCTSLYLIEVHFEVHFEVHLEVQSLILRFRDYDFRIQRPLIDLGGEFDDFWVILFF